MSGVAAPAVSRHWHESGEMPAVQILGTGGRIALMSPTSSTLETLTLHYRSPRCVESCRGVPDLASAWRHPPEPTRGSLQL